MKNENLRQSAADLSNAEEHDLFHLLRTAQCIKVTSNIPVKEELMPMELTVYNSLLHLNKDVPYHNEGLSLELLRKKFDLNYSDDDFVDIFRNLDKKYYTECAFDDKGLCVWVKLL